MTVSGTGICLPGRAKSPKCESPAVDVAAWTQYPSARRLLKMRHRKAPIKEVARPPETRASDRIRPRRLPLPVAVDKQNRVYTHMV